MGRYLEAAKVIRAAMDAAAAALTDDEALIAEMCDIAMDGDRGIVKQYGNFEFHLGKTIAKGDPVCEITVSRKE